MGPTLYGKQNTDLDSFIVTVIVYNVRELHFVNTSAPGYIPS